MLGAECPEGALMNQCRAIDSVKLRDRIPCRVQNPSRGAGRSESETMEVTPQTGVEVTRDRVSNSRSF